jgi:HK97 gp10 family phage protein
MKKGSVTEFSAWLNAIAKRVQDNSTRAAAHEMADVIYQEAKLRAPVSEAPHMFVIEGRRYGPYSPGNLRDSIYKVYSKSRSAPGIHVYHVAWNHKKAPYGFAVEFGTSKSGAMAFLGPAYEARKADAVTAGMRKAKEMFR